MAQINKPTDYFNTVLYTGNGGTQSITGVNFQPDWSWFKVRSEVGSHRLVDSVRGNTKYLFSNGTDAEATVTTNVTSFDSDGFSLGNGSINESSRTYASWNWLGANGTASNTDGSITSTVSANTTAGFSIVSYTGTGSNATVGHGLGVAPKMIIVKNRSTAGNWPVFHQTQGGTKIQWLNLTNATATESGWWNNTDPTSSVFSIGTQNDLNKSSDNIIAYCFAEKKGYSKFGSYTGNGQSEDGPFIYTGFKPAFVIVKKYDSAGGNWVMWDNKRSDVPNANVNDQVLYPNASDAELSSATREIDTLSNGFKIRGEGGNINADADNFIYMAFAENPLVGTNNIPATAR